MFGQSSTLLTTKQLAEKLGISVATIERWRANGTPDLPPHIKLSSGSFRYNPVEIDYWLKSKTHKSNTEMNGDE